MTAAQTPVRVAIIGGGIAGIAASIALDQLEGISLEITIYEQAKRLCEVGASIALGPNGLKTLNSLGLGDIADAGYRNPSGQDHIWKNGKTSDTIALTRYSWLDDENLRTSRYARSDLHNRLLACIPENRVKLSKRLSKLTVVPASQSSQNNDTFVELQFEDGSSTEADFVIGADGIRSAVRQAFVPHHKLPFSGAVAYRDIYDWDLVKNVPGLQEDATHWLSTDGVSLFTSRLPNDKFAIAAFVSGNKGSEDGFKQRWDAEGDVTQLREHFKTWCETARNTIEILPHVRQFPVFTGDSLVTWVFADKVALIGDAAHPHGGSFAAGGSLALDDSFALYLSLKHGFEAEPSNPTQAIAKALRVFDETRKEHGKRIIDAVAEKKTQRNWHGIDVPGSEHTPGSGADIYVDTKYPEWIVSHSVEEKFKEVVQANSAVAVF